MRNSKLILFFSLLMLSFTTIVTAQSFMNEWIDYDKTYYRFRVASNGIYRITQSQLDSIGIANTDASHFQLWKNGEEIALYTSSPSGALPTGGFIEFYGEINNGIWENRLYLKPEYQINKDVSVLSDSSTYFLTINTASANKRYSLLDNNLTSSLPVDSFFMHKLKSRYAGTYSQGFGAVVGSTVYSASYDEGEGYTSAAFGPASALTSNNPNLFVYPSGPNAKLVYSAAGTSLNIRNVRVVLNGNVLGEKDVNYLSSVIDSSYDNIPLSMLSSGAANFQFVNTATVSSDRMVIGFLELTYPRQFNFGGQSLFQFQLPANENGNRLVITNFNHGGIAPVIYDITNGYRLLADVTVPGQVRIVLPPSSQDRRLLISGQQATVLRSVSTFRKRNFIKYSEPSSQGDYLIVSNERVYKDDGGTDQVERYRQYRSSAAGGGYKAKVYDIEQLIDQFGYGIKNNPFSVKNFLRYARANFTQTPKFCLIIGKGVNARDYKANETRPITERINLVPTFGLPSSDLMLASDEGEYIIKTPIGRINVVSGKEVGDYLDKIIEYEKAQTNLSCKIEDEAWKKDVLHIGGANDFLGEQIMYYLNEYRVVAEDTLYGANVQTLQKTSLTNVQIVSGEIVSNLFRDGFSLLTYFGHSSANTLEFNLDNPENYPYSGKYPIFIVNGCNAGNLFLYDTLRLKGKLTLSEKYVVGFPLRGSSAFIASTHLGIVNYLNLYTQEYYNQLSKASYGQPLGKVLANISDTLISRYTANDYFVRIHLEEIVLHGDPALPFYSREKPDYAIEPQYVKASPEFISIAERNFKLDLKFFNIGRFSPDSVRINIKRQFPDGSQQVVYDAKWSGFAKIDSLELLLSINPLTDKGQNKFIITIDPDNSIDELCENNNIVTKEVFIFEDEVRPVYPYNYGIIRTSKPVFYASTANPFSSSRKYYFELDTTAFFNSSLIIKDSLVSPGGSLSFNPTLLSLKDSTVYYWRVGSRVDNTSFINWNNSSFVYRSNFNPGFNQSHFYQFTENNFEKMSLDSSSREFKFQDISRKLKIKTGLFPFYGADLNEVYIDLEYVDAWRCSFNVFSVYVFEPRSLRAWENIPVGNVGRFNSLFPCASFQTRKFFEFSMADRNSRNNMRLFLNQIPNDHYVLIINQGTGAPNFAGLNNSFISNWMSDTTVYGSGNSIYHSLINNGFSEIDKFTRNLPFAFVYQKGNPEFIYQYIGENANDYIDVGVDMPAQFTAGYTETPWLGPARKWENFQWDGYYPGGQMPRDSTVFHLYGKTQTGVENLLAVVNQAKDTSISFVDAAQYPFMRMKMFSQDPISLTPFQLKYWRLTGEMVPEGAVAPNIRFDFKDTLDLGEPLDFKIAFKNISELAFDSLKLKFIVTDRNNVPKEIPFGKKKPIVSGDTILVSYTIDTKDLPGLNSLFLFVNPDNDQPEQYLFNNFIFRSFFVKPDVYQPWLDVTFDGVHILNRDIVSSKPHITAKLKDESKFMALSDTAGMKATIRFPDRSVKEYKLGTDSARFTPANLNSGENTAVIDLFPNLLQDGEYELTITANDRVGNEASDLGYKVAFQVVNKPMISNLLNYPNPFTSSTAFVFTLTGSEVPQNIRIQILTITGKVVREITMNELGPIRIGRNITEFKWDGTDQYGNQLANGVYLYRVLTNKNGQSLDKYTPNDVNTDMFFNRGYGKMYLMR